jgi:diguanylate cyclase (GGDEF)-like protein
VSTQTAFIVISAAVAGLVGIAAVIALYGEWAARRRAAEAPEGESEALRLPVDKYESALGTAPAETPGGSFDGVIRVVWWLTIVGVLVGVGISGAYPADQGAIFAVGGAAALVVVLLHELLPPRWRSRWSMLLEVVAALALATGVVLLTGHAGSPFVFTYDLLAVAVALTIGGWAAIAVAGAAALAYLGVAWLDPARPQFSGGDLLGIALNGGSIFVLSYLAAVFATSERRLRATIERLWRIDHLTGLIRREELGPALEQEVQRSRRSDRPFCLLMCDLDGLKALNDSLGHERGDAVLRGVGSAIRRSTRTVDSAYRYGGDEFVVLLPETEYHGAYLVAEKIRAGAEEVGHAFAGGADMLTSVSVGLVSYPEDGVTADELLLAADRAMYNAKGLGKNQISGNPRPPRRLGLASAPVPFAGDEVVRPSAPASPATASTHEEFDEDEPDPSEMRRQIAVARGNMDPDHQVRRAMDAFLS